MLLPHVLGRRRQPVPDRRLQAVPRVARRGDRPRPPGRDDRPDRLGLADRRGARLPERGSLLRPAVRPRPRRRPLRVADDLAACTRFDDPVEIEEGMVFALETYCPASDGRSAARIEEEVLVTADGTEILTRFPGRGAAGRRPPTCAAPTLADAEAPRPSRRGEQRTTVSRARRRSAAGRRARARALPPHAADPPLRGRDPLAVPARRGARHDAPVRGPGGRRGRRLPRARATATGSPAPTAATATRSRSAPTRRRWWPRCSAAHRRLRRPRRLDERHRPRARPVGCFGIVGGSIGAATGAALSLQRTGNVAVAFFGDGATNQAYFHECLNFAAGPRAAGRLRLREQPLRRVHADASRSPRAPHRRPRRARSGCRPRSSTATTCGPSRDAAREAVDAPAPAAARRFSRR